MATRQSIKDGLVIGVTQAVVLLGLLYALVFFTGNQQQKALDEIANGTRAQVCVLRLAQGPFEEDPASPDYIEPEDRRTLENANLCLVANGLTP